MHLFYFPRSFIAARKFSGAGLFYWAASRHRRCLYWPVSRWESTSWHSWAGVGEELAEGWKISIKLWWVERSLNKRAAAKEEAAAWVRRADQRDTRADAVAARRDGGGGSGSGFGKRG